MMSTSSIVNSCPLFLKISFIATRQKPVDRREKHASVQEDLAGRRRAGRGAGSEGVHGRSAQLPHPQGPLEWALRLWKLGTLAGGAEAEKVLEEGVVRWAGGGRVEMLPKVRKQLEMSGASKVEFWTGWLGAT